MKLELKVNGRKYKGWENVSITKSMTSLTDTFSMNIFKGNIINILDDDIIQILIDDKLFLTGYLDNINLGIGDTKQPLRLTGRSKALDLIDCNIFENKQYNNLNIKQIINDLIKPFGLTVTTTLELEPLLSFDTKIGETYFNAINRLCKQTNTLPTSKKDGNIEIIKNTEIKSSIVLKDSDFKSLDYPRKLNKRFSEYTFKKEGIVTDVTDGNLKDDTVKRFRPFVAVNTEDKTNEDLAKWQFNHNQAESISLRAVVKNWDLEVNTIVKIETEVVSASFLIKDIIYTKSDSGTISSITFVSKDLFNA